MFQQFIEIHSIYNKTNLFAWHNDNLKLKSPWCSGKKGILVPQHNHVYVAFWVFDIKWLSIGGAILVTLPEEVLLQIYEYSCHASIIQETNDLGDKELKCNCHNNYCLLDFLLICLIKFKIQTNTVVNTVHNFPRLPTYLF